jgi:hypothetical protein
MLTFIVLQQASGTVTTINKEPTIANFCLNFGMSSESKQADYTPSLFTDISTVASRSFETSTRAGTDKHVHARVQRNATRVSKLQISIY